MIKENKIIKKLLNQKNIGPIFFITPNPNRGIGSEKEIKDYHIICAQNSDLIDYLKEAKISVFCINNESIKNSGKILEDKKVLNYIKSKSKDQIANVITFKPSPKIQKICEDNDFRYIGNDWKLNRRLENKVEFVNITNKLNIPNAKSKITRVENSEEFKSQFDSKEKYVIQLPRGFSGNSTFLIKDRNDLKKIIENFKGRTVKLSKYLNGDTYTINVCVGKFGIILSQPIFQITGLTDFNKNQLGTSGNDYQQKNKFLNKQKEEIFKLTKKIGEYMKKLDYKGIFGLDYIVNEKSIDLIEVNPRLIASIPVFTKLQIQNKEIPFLFLHFLEFLNISYNVKQLSPYLSYEEWENKNDYNFSQLILRNTKIVSIKIIKSIVSGIYELKNDKLILKQKTYYTKELKQNEVFIQCLKKDSIINSDMEYANIQFPHSVMKNENIDKSTKKIIDLILSKMKLKEIN
ncbi:MAG: ATP-grasp domain-containing protein [Patescibacteria group bacterium]|nr:ATP-grasp domain-containing protein [Patescibacteria group bacterium]